MSKNKIAEFYKALYLFERRIHWSSALFLFLGLRKIRGWKKLSGFRRSENNFGRRLSIDGLNFIKLVAILGQKRTYPKPSCDLSWAIRASNDWHANELNALRGRFAIYDEFLERGVITPFAEQISDAINRVQAVAQKEDHDTNVFLTSILQSVEQLTMKSFVLTLNINRIKGGIAGQNESEQYRVFLDHFNSSHFRQCFFREYPVLTRIVISRLDLWVKATTELILRLASDRSTLEEVLGIEVSDPLVSVKSAGDTHNSGRSVTVLFFRSGSAVVYKPRSTSIEEGFQKYLEFFNTIVPDLNLRQIRVINKGTYGWVEFVRYSKPEAGLVSDRYHYKLGFLTGIVFSLNGVDVFFENLIAADADPVIIDLESMFHTPIDTGLDASPFASSQLRLHSSVTGIGVLPHPGRGASETEVFDVTVLGAAVNAQAPYNVSSIENFGRVDMKITETPGWIHETTSSSVDGALDSAHANLVFDGLKSAFKCIRGQSARLSSPNGVVDQCFSGAERRLIVRDTKVYGSLQSDESHPDLLRDQSDREWHFDNLWSETIERPNLLRFINSEIMQLRDGDIPYFTGGLDSLSVRGADGTLINLEGILAETPIAKARSKIMNFSSAEECEQLRLAATALGLSELTKVTQPNLKLESTPLLNSLEIVDFISRRTEVLGGSTWYDTSLNPVPAAKNIDPVNVVPSDPFLYEGVLGTAMYFFDVWRINGDPKILQSSLRFTDSVLEEVAVNKSFSPSGFVGVASVIYVINRALEKGINAYEKYESSLPGLLIEVNEKVSQEEKLDFLLGIAGVGAAILPYVKRTSDKVGFKILRAIYKRLQESTDILLAEKSKIPGLDYLRGLSHGISGLALAIHRIGQLLSDSDAEDRTIKLLTLEQEFVLSGGWTDSHSYEGQPLVGWCHGSAGIVLALSQMPSITSAVDNIATYYESAFENTLERYDFQSRCLCHGSLGNLLCLQAARRKKEQVEMQMLRGERSLLTYGFRSLGAAQSMSAGLMTGLVGAGYYLLAREHSETDFDFLTLA